MLYLGTPSWYLQAVSTHMILITVVDGYESISATYGVIQYSVYHALFHNRFETSFKISALPKLRLEQLGHYLI